MEGRVGKRPGHFTCDCIKILERRAHFQALDKKWRERATPELVASKTRRTTMEPETLSLFGQS